MGAIKITTLMDNLMGGRKSFTAGHGLSLYVETGYTRILFNLGAGTHTSENGQKIKIRPDRIDFAVYSHGHYDHGGGYKESVKNGLQYSLATRRELFTEKYAVSDIRSAYLRPGSDQEFLIESHITHMECHGLTPLAPGCWVMGDIRRTYEFESVLGKFVLREQNAWVQDKFYDETHLVIGKQGELVVIVGCSHPEILNILTTVKEHFSQPTKAMIGRTHLAEADEARIRQTVRIMKDMGTRLLGFDHCSGELFRNMVEQGEILFAVYLGADDCLFLT